MDLVAERAVPKTRRDLYILWREEKGADSSAKCQHVLQAILKQFDVENLEKEVIELTKKAVYNYCNSIAKRWSSCSRIETKFYEKNGQWLDQAIRLPIFTQNILQEVEAKDINAIPSTSGRPKILFGESSERSKRRKTQELRKNTEINELTYAAQMSLRSSGQNDFAKLIGEAQTSPTRPSKMIETWHKYEESKIIRYSSDEALALYVDAKLTKSQYSKIRLQAKVRNADIYPPYYKIIKAKKQCYPDREQIIISESLMEIRLQALLDHTVIRILQIQLENETISIEKELILISKWGYDGSTGHSVYKQKIQEGVVDSEMFITSFVPLQLYFLTETNKKVIVWQNPHPSSVRYCRPIRIQYKKETSEVSLQEMQYIESQIANLNKTQVSIQEKIFFVTHKMVMTMIDGKVCNAVTQTSSAQKCYVCGATPIQMNRIDQVVTRELNIESYRFGLSTLHAWIRFFECFLHISYRLDFKKWQAREGDRETLKLRKAEIQKKFKEELGLVVDQVRPGGSGTSNDGNTARRFFKDPEVSSRITGIDKNLISRCATILQTLSSGFKINSEAFDKFAIETAKIYVNTYPWYYMPASVHKILIHGSSVISNAVLPIGQLSEEAQECRNKDLKSFRRNNTRKKSRESTNEDLMNLLLITSDPVITSLRKIPRKAKQKLSPEVLVLLVPPESDEEEFGHSGSQDEISSSSNYSDSDCSDD